jgi:EmrB/QacA subfamily drug resistance transporter
VAYRRRIATNVALPTPTAPPGFDRRWLTLGVLCLSLLVVGIDTSILNVAIPTLIRELDATPAQLQWIVDSYVLVFAGLLLTAGKLGDRFGRKGVMSAGLLAFGASSLGAATASSPGALILWRGIMGVGAALIMPATLSILVNVFTEERQRRRAIAYWSLMNAAGAFIGPVTGGLLLRHFWWGSCFLVNVPFVAGTLLLGRWLVPSSKDPEAAAGFDLLGAGLSSAALGALLWAVIEGPARGWTAPAVVIGFLAAAGLIASFVAWELRVSDPMLDLRILRSPQMSAAVITMTIAFMALSGSMYLVSQSLQLVKGYTPLAAALATSAPIVTMNFLVMPRAPGLAERFGPRRMIAVAMILIAVADLVISTMTLHSSYLDLGAGFALMALGFSMFVPASTEAVMTAVPAEKAGSASAVNQMCRQLGQALGIAVTGSVGASFYRSSFKAPDGLVGDAAARAGDSMTGAFDVARGAAGRLGELVLTAAREAFLSGMRAALVVAAVLAVVGAAYAARAIPDSVRRLTEEERTEGELVAE